MTVKKNTTHTLTHVRTHTHTHTRSKAVAEFMIIIINAILAVSCRLPTGVCDFVTAPAFFLLSALLIGN